VARSGTGMDGAGKGNEGVGRLCGKALRESTGFRISGAKETLLR